MLDRTCVEPRWQQSDPLSGRELRGLMHDLSHGLATLSFLVQGISDDPDLSADVRHRAGLIEKQLDLLLDVVDLRGVRQETGNVEVRGLLSELVSLTAWSTPTWVALRPGPPVDLRVDSTVLWRMVTNLVDNAVTAAGQTGMVEVEVSRTVDGAVRIEVADDGPGFGVESGNADACGLGIVRRLARVCGASLRVHSIENQGARVQVVFGVANAQVS